MLQRFLVAGLILLSFGMCYFACSANVSSLEHSKTSNPDLLDLVTDSDQNGKPCISAQTTDVLSSRPVDVIFVIDNSGSMDEELASIADNINEHFADVMTSAGLDYRVIMIVKHGGQVSWGQVCIEAPLSTIPKGGCALINGNPPGNNPGKFYHYSYDVQSSDSPCVILDTLTATNNRPDTFGLAPNGWIKWLRKSAFKVFIEVTDDMPNCTWYADPINEKGKKVFNDFQSNIGGQIMTTEWDKTLMKLAPDQFGTLDKRNYAFFSVVGMLEKPEAIDDDTGLLIDPSGNPDDPFVPNEGVVADVCSTAVSPGFGYQHISKLTGGLRFPVCQAKKFDVVFQKIVGSIDSITSTTCTIDVPSDGTEGPIAIDTIQLVIENQSGDVFNLKKVASSAACSEAPDEFYIDLVSSTVVLCPDSCLNAKAVAKDVKMTAACDPIVN
jgi:hypothetical protein